MENLVFLFPGQGSQYDSRIARVKILFKIKTIWVVIFKREGIYGKDGINWDYSDKNEWERRR